MGQQENSVGLDSFKLNYLHSANEQQRTILFKHVCCDFYKNVWIIAKNNLHEIQSHIGLFIDSIFWEK